MYERKFDPQYTEEVRIYGFDGDDKFVIHGDNDKIKIRLIGGEEKIFLRTRVRARHNSIVYDKIDGGNKLIGNFEINYPLILVSINLTALVLNTTA